MLKNLLLLEEGVQQSDERGWVQQSDGGSRGAGEPVQAAHGAAAGACVVSRGTIVVQHAGPNNLGFACLTSAGGLPAAVSA